MIPGLSERKGNQIALALLVGIVAMFAYAWQQVAADRRSLQEHGVLVLAAISYKQYLKGEAQLTVNYKYEGHYYYNTLRTEKLEYKPGDSVTIKINAQNPAGYCGLAADSSQ